MSSLLEPDQPSKNPHTPTSEAPFAFHLSLGTAVTLYSNGYLENAQPPLHEAFQGLLTQDFDLRTRMYVMLVGVTEDAANGNAHCRLAGLRAYPDSGVD